MAIPRDEKLIKVMVKVLNEDRDELRWEHLCYAPALLYLKFLTVKDIERFELAEYLSKWAMFDFNIDLQMTKSSDLALLKELIVNRYKKMFPYLARSFNDSHVDHQGWVRIWLADHMERELRRK